MVANRRTSPRGPRPGGQRGPGRVPTGARGPRPATEGARSAGEPGRRPRLTGRALILVLVLALLAVSYASSMRAYLQQRAHIADLKAQIAQRESNIDQLEREKRRWHDPAYVASQARARFGYLMPGETSYVVIGEDGRPLEAETTLTDPATIDRRTPTAWWSEEWRSVELAGHPPKPKAPPATRIDGSQR
jgi:cell division protein FtsB